MGSHGEVLLRPAERTVTAEVKEPALRFKLVLVCFLVVLSAAYLGKGFWVDLYSTTGKFPGAGDLSRRWVEEQYVTHGLNPYDFGPGGVANAHDRAVAADASLGIPAGVDYPPWAYFSGLALCWPGWPQVRVWYAVVNLACLAYIISMLLRFTREESLLDRTLLVLSVTAVAAICTTIGSGNYGVIVLALLAGSFEAYEAGHFGLAGLLMGIAALKPNMSGPFLLIPLMQWRIRALVSAGVYLAVASAVVWLMTHTDTLTMLGQMIRVGSHYASTDTGPLKALVSAGVPEHVAVILAAAICLSIFVPLLYLYRNTPDPILLFAIASLTGRLWTYNSNHSDTILVFLLLAQWRLAARTKDSRAFAVFVATAASLWIPAKVADNHLLQVATTAVWLSGLGYLLVKWPLSGGQTDRLSLINEAAPEVLGDLR